jgi:hypothetical protein
VPAARRQGRAAKPEGRRAIVPDVGGVESGSPWEVPPPVLFNVWKHHAGALRHHVSLAAGEGEPGLAALAGQLVVIGSELMDLYTGPLTPRRIADEVVAGLDAAGLLDADAYRRWIEESGEYAVVELPGDGSRWVLRRGKEAERYVHVHPGRWAPQTRRVRANVLKTAVMALALAQAIGGDPFDVGLVNEARRRYLGLSPVPSVGGQEGLGALLAALREGE